MTVAENPKLITEIETCGPCYGTGIGIGDQLCLVCKGTGEVTAEYPATVTPGDAGGDGK
jgi:DnaJ-class molecular chaperone